MSSNNKINIILSTLYRYLLTNKYIHRSIIYYIINKTLSFYSASILTIVVVSATLEQTPRFMSRYEGLISLAKVNFAMDYYLLSIALANRYADSIYLNCQRSLKRFEGERTNCHLYKYFLYYLQGVIKSMQNLRHFNRFL